MPRHRIPARVALLWATTSLLCACRITAPIARITYGANPEVRRVAQAVIDEWGGPRRVEVVGAVAQATAAEGDMGYAMAVARTPHVVAAVGPPSSRATLLVAATYRNERIPLIVTTATSDRIGELGPTVFQVTSNNAAEGEFIIRFLVDVKQLKHIAIFYLSHDEYGLGLRDGLVAALRRRGLAPAETIGFIPPADLVARLRHHFPKGLPEAVAIVARGPETSTLVRLLAADRSPVIVVSDGAPLNSSFDNLPAQVPPGLYGVTWWTADRADSVSRAFVRRFQQMIGRDPTAEEALAYDAIMLAAEAVREGARTRAEITSHLRALGRNSPPYHGVTGDISFAADRPINFVMRHVRSDGSIETVEVPR